MASSRLESVSEELKALPSLKADPDLGLVHVQLQPVVAHPLLDVQVPAYRNGTWRVLWWLGRNRKTRPEPRQSLPNIPSTLVGYTLGYTKLTIGRTANVARTTDHPANFRDYGRERAAVRGTWIGYAATAHFAWFVHPRQGTPPRCTSAFGPIPLT